MCHDLFSPFETAQHTKNFDQVRKVFPTVISEQPRLEGAGSLQLRVPFVFYKVEVDILDWDIYPQGGGTWG